MDKEYDFIDDSDLNNFQKNTRRRKKKEVKSLDDLIRDQLMRNIDNRNFDLIFEDDQPEE